MMDEGRAVHAPVDAPMNVIVIGGGVGGLAAAWELVRAGHRVRLYEAAPGWGGQVRTFEVGGGRIECFYHHLFRSDEVMVELIEELGLGADLEWVESTVGLQIGERRYPLVTPWDLLRLSAVSPLTRIRLGLAALWLRRFTDWHRYEGRSAADWIRSRVGREGYERVWGPLLRAKFGEHSEEISLAWFWGKVHLRFSSRDGGPFARERLGYLRGSFGRYVDALVEAIRARGGVLENGRAVRRVVVEHGRAIGVEVEHDGGVRLEHADAVIATVPSGLFRQLVPELDTVDGGTYAGLLERVEYRWATVLILALDRPLSDVYWLTMADADCPFVAAVEQTNFRSPAEYGGLHVIYFSNYCDPGDPVVEADAAATLERYLPYIRRINPEFDDSWIEGLWLFRDRAGQPIVHTRYHETVPPHRTPIDGLYLANTTQIYPEDRGQNYSIRLGQRVARLAIADGQRDAADSPAL